MRVWTSLLLVAVFLLQRAPEAHAVSWDACLNQKDSDTSIAGCTAILQAGGLSRQNKSIAYYNRGVSYQAKGERVLAIADFTQAIEFDSRDPSAFNNRANVYEDLGQHERAIADFTAAIQRDPKNPLPLSNRGVAFMANNQYDHAIRDFDAALALDPQMASALSNRANAYVTRQRFDDAFADATKAIELDPDNYKNFVVRGRASLGKGDTASALADFKRARVIEPGDRSVLALIEKAQTPASLPVSRQPDEAEPSPAIIDETRVALVIGNGRYSAVQPLPNPPNDADAIAATLRGLGFKKVTLVHDLTRDGLLAALRQFGDDAETADWAVVYFAGHGIELNGTNYLVPVDAKLKSDRDVDLETVDLAKVVRATETARKLRLVLIDACRDNPFLDVMRRTSVTRSIGSHGLARVEPEGGTLVAYAAKAGEVAIDGNDANSPFVTALVKRMQMPHVEISKLFRLVRDDVLNATKQRQEPFTYGSLPGQDFFFNVGQNR